MPDRERTIHPDGSVLLDPTAEPESAEGNGGTLLVFLLLLAAALAAGLYFFVWK